MSILSEMLQEEYERLERTIQSYEQIVAELPKGSVRNKRISGRTYPYLQWRSGEKVKSRYLKADEVKDISEKVSRRKHYERELRKMYHSKKEFEKVLRKDL